MNIRKLEPLQIIQLHEKEFSHFQIGIIYKEAKELFIGERKEEVRINN